MIYEDCSRQKGSWKEILKNGGDLMIMVDMLENVINTRSVQNVFGRTHNSSRNEQQNFKSS